MIIMDAKRVLHMTKLGPGGISTLTVNIQSLLDRELVNFDYLVFDSSPTFYEEKVYSLNGKKQIVDVLRYNNNKLLLYYKKYIGAKELIKKEHYDIVHVDASTPMDVVIGIAAKHAGAKVRILHSHIAGDNKHSYIRSIYLQICRFAMRSVFTDYFSISVSAAEFMFPKAVVKNNSYQLIKNGIIADRYRFDKNERKRERNRLGLKDKYVIGHVGRFSQEKNHLFLIDVFNSIKSKNRDARLLLIGEGQLKENVQKRVAELGLEKDVILYGTSQEIPSLLSAMDVFVFPSKYEGLGLAAIEAQCSGLPTICSEGIPEEANITDLFKRVQGYNCETWAKTILTESIDETRRDRIEDIKNAGYDLKEVANYLQNFYISKSST